MLAEANGSASVPVDCLRVVVVGVGPRAVATRLRVMIVRRVLESGAADWVEVDVSWGECTVGSQPLSPFCIPDVLSLALTPNTCSELGELVLLVRGGASAFAGVGWECRWFLK